LRKLESVAIIPDGNRRYALKKGLSLGQGYAKGFQKVRDVIEWSDGVPKITFWALSLDNLARRSKAEVNALFALMNGHVSRALSEKNFEGVKVSFFGELGLLPQALSNKMRELEEKTDGDRTAFIGIAYGGEQEIYRAAKKMAEALANGAPEREAKLAFAEGLYYQGKPDLIIRTGSAQRLSGFLPLQSCYSELYFSKKLWPEFGKSDFEKATEFFQESQARYGR